MPRGFSHDVSKDAEIGHKTRSVSFSLDALYGGEMKERE